METKHLEAAVRATMAKAFIDNLPADVKEEIMASSVEKTFQDLCDSYTMREEIRNQLHEEMKVYVVEYVKDPDVQARLKRTAHETVDMMFDAVLKSMVHDLQRNIKSEYHDFLKEQ